MRHIVALMLCGTIILGTGLAILGLGYSGRAAILGTVLAAALTWVPVLIALEGLSRERRPDTWMDR